MVFIFVLQLLLHYVILLLLNIAYMQITNETLGKTNSDLL